MAKNPYADEIKWWQNRTKEFDAKRAALRPLSFEHVSGAYKHAGNKNGEWTFDSSKIDMDNEWSRLYNLQKLQGAQTEYLGWGFARAKWPPPKGKGGTTREPTHASVLKSSDKILDLEHKNDTLFNKIADVGGTFARGAFKGLAIVGDIIERTGYAARSVMQENMNEYKGADTSGGADITTGEFLASIGKAVVDFATPVAAVKTAHALIADGTEQDEQIRAAWSGLSGKNKIFFDELLKETYPEWTSNHKKWTTAIGFGGDLLTNPLNYVTLGDGAVVQGAIRGTASVGLRAVGARSMSESLLKTTVWTGTGRKAGREALEDWARQRALKPEWKDVKSASKANAKAGKKVRKATAKGSSNLPGLKQAATRSEAAFQRAQKALLDAHEAQVADAFKGMKLARKALFNKTLGFGAYNAYSKGVRSGGLATGAAKAYENGMKALQLRYADDLFKGPQAKTMRKYHALLAGETVKLANKVYTVPEDYDDFIPWFTEKVHPIVPIKELTKSATKRRYAMDNAAQARGAQFHYEFQRAARAKYFAAGTNPPPNWGAGIPNNPPNTPMPPGGGHPRPSGGGGSGTPPPSAGPNRPPGGGGSSPNRPPNRPPGGGGGNPPTPTGPAHAPEPPPGHGEELPEFEPEPAATGAPHTSVHVSTADDAVNSIIDSEARRVAQDQRYWDNMTDAERVYAERMNYTPSLMSYKLFAKHMIDHTNPENIAIVNDFINDVRRGLSESIGEGRLTQGGETVGVKQTPILDAEGNIENLMPEIQKWSDYRGAEKSPDYNRALNAEIARVISHAWDVAQHKLAITEMANDPVSVVNAIQGSTAHIINQLTADTHIQVNQFLTSKYGLSFLPMAPNKAVINSGMRGGIRGVGDIAPFIEKGVTYRNPRGGTSTVAGPALRTAILTKLQNDLEPLRQMWGTPEGQHILHVGDEGMLDDYTSLWLDRPLTAGFGDTEVAAIVGAGAQTFEVAQQSGKAYYSAGPHMQSLKDAVFTLLSKGSVLIDDLHFKVNDSISNYSLLDYWLYGDNIAKELKISGSAGEEIIGRLAHVGKISNEDQAFLAAIKETIPQMDEELLSALRMIKAHIADHDEVIPSIWKVELNELVSGMLTPDLVRLYGNPGPGQLLLDQPSIIKAMETLGWHVDNITNSIHVPGGTSIAVRTAMARDIWNLPVLYKELNQSLMLGTLHHVVAARRNTEQAADAIALVVKKYPLVEDLLSGAHAAGTTNGTNGVRTSVRVDTFDANAPVPAPVHPPGGSGSPPNNVPPRGPEPEPPEPDPMGIGPEPDPTPAPGTVDGAVHGATESTPAADDGTVPTTDPKASATSSEPSPKTEAEGKAAADDPASNPPGGFSTPTEITPEQRGEIDKFIQEMKAGTNLAEVKRVIADAESAMNASFAEYHALVKAEFEDFRIKTGKVVRFMGMPVAPVPTMLTPGQNYAGVIGLKEKQSRVSNWLDKAWPESTESRMKAQLMLRRPSKSLDAVVNDIRRSVANNAQERLIATHAKIRETYITFKSKSERMADTRLYFTEGVPMPAKFKDIDDRLKTIGKSITHEADGKPRSPKVQQMYAEQFNHALPKKYQMPEEVLNGKAWSDLKKADPSFVVPTEPFSREWLIGASKWMDSQGTWQHKVLSATVLKSNLHMGNYEFALHHALMKLELDRDLHLSMFDNFTFRMDEGLVKTLNKDLAFIDQFVKLDTYYGAETSKYVNKEYANRWVRRGMAEEMSKATRFIEQQNVYRAGNMNFGVMTKINNYWKSMVTNWNIPNYHIGNVMSDGFLNAMDGVKPDAYRKAAIVMSNSHPVRNRIKQDPEGYARLMRADLPVEVGDYAKEMKELGDPTRARAVTMIMVNGKPTALDSEMIFKLYHDYGLGQTQVNGNILRSSAVPHNKIQEFYTNVTDKVLDLSNGREDYFRIAHFISALESESKLTRRSLEDIVVAARDRVIKYHFDYGDVTELERLAVARYMPFYKWQRNILPLAVGQLFTNPRMYTIGNAANRAMGEMMFPSQEDANGNTIPVDYITPQFVGDSNMVPIGKYTDTEGNEQARYAVLNLPLDQALVTWLMPFVSAVADPNVGMAAGVNQGVRNTGSTLLSKSNPFIAAMAQAGLGKTAVAGDTFTSKPYDWLKTLGGVAAPGASQAIEAIENSQKGEPQKTWAGQVGIIRERKNTGGIQRGTLREENDKMTAVYIRAAADWMKKNYPGVEANSEEGKKILHDYFVSTGTLQK